MNPDVVRTLRLATTLRIVPVRLQGVDMNQIATVFRFVAIGILALLSGCATNTITGRSQLMMVSEESAISSSSSAYASMLGSLAKKDKIETGTARVARVREITDRLIAQAVRFRPDSAAWDWQVQVIQEPKVVNAFCMAGGKMAIYTGFWDRLNATDDEIAAVMGHEIGHALASHTREKMSVGITAQLGALVAAAIISRNAPGNFQRNNNDMQSLAALAVTLPNSRDAENEADQIGIELAARAGFDPAAAVTLWQKMQQLDGMRPPEFLSTHPSHDTRIQNLASLVPRVQPLYEMAKAGKSTADVPTFLAATKEEREAGAAQRQAFAARAATEPDTMSFVSESFEKFRRGETVFDCRFACAFAFGNHRSEWVTMRGEGRWRDLAISVIKVGYLSDLSYFLLGEAAQSFGLRDSARTYYGRAVDAAKAGNGCAGMFDSCEGLEVQSLSAAALAR